MKPSDYIRKGWCRGASAKDKDGIVVPPTASDAAQWCTYGAIVAAYPEDILARERIMQKIKEHIVGLVPEWNDAPKRTQQQVIDLLITVGE